MAWTNAVNILDGVNAIGNIVDQNKTTLSSISTTVNSIDSDLAEAMETLRSIDNKLTGMDVSVDLTPVTSLLTNATYGLQAIKTILKG